MDNEEIQQEFVNQPNKPWLEHRLTKEAMDRLWDDINGEQTPVDGKISLQQTMRSAFIEDKDNWFYANVLKEFVEYLYYKDWNNYYNVHVAKFVPAPVFELNEFWVNYQKQHEANPLHAHSGLYSFVVFMKIPTHWKDQHAIPWLKDINDNEAQASNFQFLWGQGNGPVQTVSIPLSPEDDGRMLFFPAWMHHQVFPFYESEGERITLSGNITFSENYDKIFLGY